MSDIQQVAQMKRGVPPLPRGKARVHSISFVLNDNEYYNLQNSVRLSEQSRSALLRTILRAGGFI